jgi:hypothetical protein
MVSDRLPEDGLLVEGRRGDDSMPFVALPLEDGRPVLHAEELDLLALRFAGIGTFTGYLRVHDGLAPLPAGSRLDPASGSFTWQPGAGFLGSYDLVFVREQDGHPVARQDARVVIHPKTRGHGGAQVVIDTPSRLGTAQVTAGEPFLLAGWAADLDAWTGTGVSAVHVWAYPARGGSPRWIGRADYGGNRPDVAALLGNRFTASGYGLWVNGLEPGEYDLAVFAWSDVEGRFAPAAVVRVAVRAPGGTLPPL